MGKGMSAGLANPARSRAMKSIASVRVLLQEYWDSFGFTPCFQNFGDELAGLPGAYSPPDGRLAVATVVDAQARCMCCPVLPGCGLC